MLVIEKLLKFFQLLFLGLTFIFLESCSNENNKLQRISKEPPIEAEFRCGKFYASGNVVLSSYTFCSIIPIEVDYYYKKGKWTFWNQNNNKIAEGIFNNNLITKDGIGGCPYSFYNDKINLDKWKFWNGRGEVIKLENEEVSIFEDCNVYSSFKKQVKPDFRLNLIGR